MMIFNPAVRLMKQMTYARKMLVSGFFVCIPIALLVYFLVTNIREQVEFGAKERSGVRYVMPLRNVLSLFLESRREILLHGKAVADTGKVQVELDRIEGQLGSELATAGFVRTLKSKLGEVNGMQGATARQVFDAHTALVGTLMELIVLVADNSNLTLDPDIDSYYLMDTLITKLPPLADALARIELVTSRHAVGDKTDFIVLSGQVRTLVEAINKNIRSACTKNPALAQILQKPFQDVEASSTALLKSAAASLEAKASPISQNVSSTSNVARDAVFKAFDVVMPALDGLLAARIHTYQMRMSGYLSLSFLAFLLGVYLNIGSFLSVREGIASVRDVAARVAKGDLTVEAPQLSHDELGEMAHMFNIMTENLRHIIVTLSGVTDKVHSFAGMLSDSVEHQAGFSCQLSSSVTEISATMEEFSSTANQIACHSHEVVAIADRTLQGTRDGATGVETLAMKISDISNDNEDSLREIMELGRKSKEITKIMEIIGNIAYQTKLIAFNAALEASSAGEAGKRFGVVAVEIRRLADNVVESASQTEGKITEIMDAVNRLVIASEKGSKGIREGLDYSGKTMEMLCEVVDGASSTSEAAKQISLSTQQQQLASNQVVLSLYEIKEGTRHSSDSIQQINSISKELTVMSSDLKELMGRFSLHVA